jgi:hypothetical protein
MPSHSVAVVFAAGFIDFDLICCWICPATGFSPGLLSIEYLLRPKLVVLCHYRICSIYNISSWGFDLIEDFIGWLHLTEVLWSMIPCTWYYVTRPLSGELGMIPCTRYYVTWPLSGELWVWIMLSGWVLHDLETRELTENAIINGCNVTESFVIVPVLLPDCSRDISRDIWELRSRESGCELGDCRHNCDLAVQIRP